MDIDPHLQLTSKFVNKNASPIALESSMRHHQYTGSRMEKFSDAASPNQAQQKFTLPVMNINGGTFSRALSTAPNENSNNNNNINILNSILTIDQKFKVGRKIGSGNFGEIRIGKNTLNNENVAIKFEKSSHSSLLQNEYKFYKTLESHDGIPNIYFFGQCANQHNALVMELLGPSLEDMFNLCDRKFTPKTVCMIAIQLLKILEYVHSKFLIFRDIKPENFLIGRQSLNKHRTIYMIDFGLAKEYMNPKTNKHIPYCENKSLTGTARYMSINTHLGREQSRRDDLEAVAHMLFYFLRGKLPWQGLQADTFKERYRKIGEVKQKTSLDDLTQGFPKEFGDFLKYCRELEFLKTPDYKKWINKFEDLMRKRNWWSPNDDSYTKWEFDWIEKLNQAKSSKNSSTANNNTNNNNNGQSSLYSGEISDIKNFKYQKNLKETYNRVLQNYNKTQVLNSSSIVNNNNNSNLINNNSPSTVNNNNNNNKAKLPFLSNSFNNPNNSAINYLKPSVESSPVFKKEPNFCKVLKEKFRTKFQNQKVTTTATPIKIINAGNNNIATISNSYVPKFNSRNIEGNLNAISNNNNNINIYSSSIIKTNNYPITAEHYTSQYTHSSPNFYYNYNFADSNHVSNSYYDNLDKYKL